MNLNWKKWILYGCLLAGILSLVACAGKRLPTLSSRYYFIPSHERNLYINETVNLTRNSAIGSTFTAQLRNYYENHSKIRKVRYPDANLILTIYIIDYKLISSPTFNESGKNNLSIQVNLEVDLLRKSKSEQFKTSLRPYDNNNNNNAYLKRVPIRITARSDEPLTGSNSVSNLESLLMIKLIRLLDYFFQTGNPPPETY